ncbi:MAG: hypothetical protein WA326_07385, partial [Nitrososphaeraceae archaeon]
MILSISPLAFGQNESLAPFSSLDKNPLTSNSDMETSPVLSNNQKPSQEEHTNFHPLFQAIDLNSSAPTSTSSAPTSTFIVGEQNETQRQTALSSSSPRHPREPLTQYQTIIRPQVTLPPAVNFPSTTGIGGNTIFPQTTLAGSGTL